MKSIIKKLTKQLPKPQWLIRKIESFKIEQENLRIENELEKYRHDWVLIMRGLAVRDAETEKTREFDRFDLYGMGHLMESWELKQMQSLPLEVKILKAQQRIKEWYEAWEGNVYVSFSGGKDSTVLLKLVRELYPDIPGVFLNTGLEYPEIVEFVKTKENITWLKPKMTFNKGS